LPARALDRLNGSAPALLDRDAEVFLREFDRRAQYPRQLDVADTVVDAVGPVDPAALNQVALHAQFRRDGGDLARVVRLDAADRDQGVAALRERIGHEVFQLAKLVAAACKAAVAILSFSPDAQLAAQTIAEPHERLQRRRPEGKGIALK